MCDLVEKSIKKDWWKNLTRLIAKDKTQAGGGEEEGEEEFSW